MRGRQKTGQKTLEHAIQYEIAQRSKFMTIRISIVCRMQWACARSTHVFINYHYSIAWIHRSVLLEEMKTV